MAYLKVLWHYFPGGTEGEHEAVSQDNRTAGRKSNLGYTEYESVALTATPRLQITRLETLSKVAKDLGHFSQQQERVSNRCLPNKSLDG
jgi:hypothetical protein